MNSSHPNHGSAPAAASPSDSAQKLQASRTANLFPNLNDEHLLRELLIDAIRNCDKSRDEISDEMSLLLHARVTRRALDLYTAESADQNRFPMQYARAFAQVTGDDRILRALAELSGLKVIGADEQALLELGRESLRHKRTVAKIADLEIRLEGVVL